MDCSWAEAGGISERAGRRGRGRRFLILGSGGKEAPWEGVAGGTLPGCPPNSRSFLSSDSVPGRYYPCCGLPQITPAASRKGAAKYLPLPLPACLTYRPPFLPSLSPPCWALVDDSSRPLLGPPHPRETECPWPCMPLQALSLGGTGRSRSKFKRTTLRLREGGRDHRSVYTLISVVSHLWQRK